MENVADNAVLKGVFSEKAEFAPLEDRPIFIAAWADNHLFQPEIPGNKADVERIHKTDAELILDRHNKTVQGVAEESGLQVTNAINPEHITSLLSKTNSRKDQVFMNIIFMQALQTELDGMFDQMNELLDEIRENDRKIKEGLNILKTRDSDEARVFLMNEYDYESEDLETLTDQEVLEIVAEEVGQTVLDQEMLKQQMKTLAEEYRHKVGTSESPEFEQEYLDKLAALEIEAKQYDLDYEKAFLEVIEEGNYDYDLLEARDGHEDHSLLRKTFSAHSAPEKVEELVESHNDEFETFEKGIENGVDSPHAGLPIKHNI